MAEEKKRRGRPPGSKTKNSVGEVQKRRGRPPGSKNATKKRFKNVNEVYFGSEPMFENVSFDTDESYNEALSKALNWYNSNSTESQWKKWASESLGKKATNNVNDRELKMLGILLRLQKRGFPLRENELERIQSDIKEFSTKAPVKVDSDSNGKKNRYELIQEGIKKKTQATLGVLEAVLDSILFGEKVVNEKTSWMDLGVVIPNGSVYYKAISERLEMHLKELNELVSTFKKKNLTDDEEQLKEGWSNLSNQQILKYKSALEQLLSMANSVANVNKLSKRGRKAKPKSEDVLVKKVKFLAGDEKLGIQSISPKKILNSEELWVFDTKKRTLGVFYSKNNQGFGVKGTTLLNVNTESSYFKKIRKPEKQLVGINELSKVGLRKLLEGVRGKSNKIKTTRLNKNMILIRSF